MRNRIESRVGKIPKGTHIEVYGFPVEDLSREELISCIFFASRKIENLLSRTKRIVADNGAVDTLTDFQQFATLKAAQNFVSKMA